LIGSKVLCTSSGFLAMEYYALILNRSFAIFVFPEGLYGCKFRGPVSASDPSYFQRYTGMLHDPWLVQSPNRLQELVKKRGNFFIPRSNILTADFVNKQKWGMGGIPHSGRIFLRLANGTSRELILLGSVEGEMIRRTILSANNPRV
jgi:hypothetical protein